MKKLMVIGIITIIIGSGIIPSTVGIIENTNNESNFRSDGYIQGLIDNASAGDTIYVPAGIYHEKIHIHKSISLIGKDKNTTIIDGGGSGYGSVVTITADWVNINGFTIRNGESSGIIIYSDFISISDNYIWHNGRGIYIFLPIFSGCNISNNIISYNGDGIGLSCDSHIITNNVISNNENAGILLRESSWNNITRNTISYNKYGIYFRRSDNNNILKNNFINNTIHIRYLYHCDIYRGWLGSGIYLYAKNIWSQNYWGRARKNPKIIPGIMLITISFYGRLSSVSLPIGLFLWFNIDWRPALKPYDIG